MKKHNAANERIKRKYFAFLKEAKRHSEPTVDTAAKALSRFEVHTAIAISRHFTSSRPLPSRGTLPSKEARKPEKS